MLVLSGADVAAVDPPTLLPELRTILRRLGPVARRSSSLLG
jgi:hypothetical protein